MLFLGCDLVRSFAARLRCVPLSSVIRYIVRGNINGNRRIACETTEAPGTTSSVEYLNRPGWTCGRRATCSALPDTDTGTALQLDEAQNAMGLLCWVERMSPEFPALLQPHGVAQAAPPSWPVKRHAKLQSPALLRVTRQKLSQEETANIIHVRIHLRRIPLRIPLEAIRFCIPREIRDNCCPSKYSSSSFRRSKQTDIVHVSFTSHNTLGVLENLCRLADCSTGRLDGPTSSASGVCKPHQPRQV